MAFFNGKAKTITKANDIEPELSMSRQEILHMIDKWISEGSRWTIDIEPELSMSRQEILNVIDKWISEGSRWTIDTVDGHYLNLKHYHI